MLSVICLKTGLEGVEFIAAITDSKALIGFRDRGFLCSLAQPLLKALGAGGKIQK